MENTPYIILSFDFNLIKPKIKSNETMRFNETDKIKVNTVTINKIEYMNY